LSISNVQVTVRLLYLDSLMNAYSWSYNENSNQGSLEVNVIYIGLVKYSASV